MKHSKIMELLEAVCDDIEPVANQKVAAAIILKNDIISIGHNKAKSHPFQAKYTRHSNAILFHAETNAICNALKKINAEDLKKSSLYVFRSHKNKSWGLAKPCLGCMKCIVNFDIKNVFFTCDSGNIERL